MPKYKKRILTAAAIIIIIAAAIATTAFVLKLAYNFLIILNQADENASATIIAAMITAFVAIIAATTNHRHSKQLQAEEAHRERKVEIYSNFLAIVQRMLAANNSNVQADPVSEEELINFMVNFKTDIILWGSPGVVKSLLNFQNLSGAENNPKKTLHAVNDLYIEIRKDLGLSNRGLNNSELVKIYLDDPASLE